MLQKLLWLSAGVICGVGLSSTFAHDVKRSSVEFKIMSVSLDDAREKAFENLKDTSFTSNLLVNGSNVVAVKRGDCKDAAREGDSYSCRAVLVHSI